MKRNIVVSGSLAYDRIMDFSGYFHEHILPEKIHVLNVCFQVNGVKEKFGGTAGNIAYSLMLMGQRPLVSATIGRDYHRYFDWLEKNGISTEFIRIIEDELTACAYITTDLADNQITGWNPGAMNRASALDFDRFDPGETLLIISPGNLEDMINYPRVCKERGIEYIFDPGQSLPMLGPADLAEAIEGSSILISNDYELDLIMKKTSLTRQDLLKRTGALITTLGELGSRILTLYGETAIPTASAKEVVDPTGAGDSYRGGLISGLVEGREIAHCARLGSVCASFAVECYGTQEYRFGSEEFNERLRVCSDGCGE
jgi:adenosine kinase